MSPLEFLRLQDELQKSIAELADVNAHLRESEQELERRVEERTRELSTLLRVSHNITTTLELESLLGLILDQLKEVVEYKLASISILEKEDELSILAVRGEGMPPQGTRLQISEHSNARNMLASMQPSFVPDLNANLPLAERMRADLAAQNLYGLGSWMNAPLVFRDKSIGLLALAHPDVNYYDSARVELAMAFANQAAIAIENSRLFTAQQRRAEQFFVLAEVGRRITSILSQEQLLVETARLIRDTFGYHHVHIGLVENGHVTFRTRDAAPGDELFQCCEDVQPVVGGKSVVGWVAESGQPLLVPDVSKDARFIPSKNERTQSEASIPIKIKDQIIGVIDVESNRLDDFDENDVIILKSLADQVAVALENAKFYDQAQRLASLHERQKLARELHDSVSQALYGIVLGARTARTLLDRDPSKATEPIDYILSLAEAGLAEMRALIFELRPESLQTEGLVAALDRLVHALGARHQFEVRFEAGDEPEMPLEAKEALYRVAQETMNNVAKHARAKKVTVRLAIEDGILSMDISDDGIGFDLDQRFPGHLGLHSMRERVEQLGGRINLESAPGQGTHIHVTVPLNQFQ